MSNLSKVFTVKATGDQWAALIAAVTFALQHAGGSTPQALGAVADAHNVLVDQINAQAGEDA